MPEVNPIKNSTIPSTISRKAHRLGRDVDSESSTIAYMRAVVGTICCCCSRLPFGTFAIAPEYWPSCVMMDDP